MKKKLQIKIENHYAVLEYWHEPENGHWLILKDGYNWFNQTGMHEDTLTKLWASLKLISKN